MLALSAAGAGGLLVLGLVGVAMGAELFVRGAARLSAVIGIPPLVIGLTIVAYGTSAPELAVSAHSSIIGQADIAVGNVVGSNICNVLLVLGLSALAGPLTVSRQLIRWEVPIVIAISFLLLFMGMDGRISPAEGLFLFAGCVAYTAWAIRQGRKEGAARREAEASVGEITDDKVSQTQSLGWQIVLIVSGLVVLVACAHWVVMGAVTIAGLLGVSELVIGLTVIAVGTSLPELATSVVASIRGERDIAVGNVVGSNIMNILLVVGVAAILARGGLQVAPAALRFDIPVMIAVALCCFPIFLTGSVISRWEGAFFVIYYIAYTAHLALKASERKAMTSLDTMVAVFIVPLVVVTLLVAVQTLVRVRRRSAAGSGS